jgi:glycosyltransferase involved in cell wall biosynthesis
MRVFYVINTFNQGGAEHGLLTLLENDFFFGHDLTVIGLCRGHGGVADDVRRLVGCHDFIIADPSETLTLRSLIKGAQVMRRELARRKPDVVVLSLKQANIVGRVVLCLFPHVRCVSFEHIMRYRSRRFQWSYKYVLWLLSFRVDEIWGDCRDTIQATSRYFMPGRRRASHVVPLFCVPEDQEAKTTYAIDGVTRVVLAGRLSPVKNIDKVIEAVHRLRSAGRNVRLDVFGEGSEREGLQHRIDTLGLGAHVALLGFHKDWQAEAIKYDIYVNASDTEGFCIVAAEAMAVGLPVISTNVGGIREYGSDKENMLKVETADPVLLAELIGQLIDDPELRGALGRRAASDIRHQYSPASLRAAGGKILQKRIENAR